MKKIYFFIVALVLGVMSASAANYYLVGGFNGWNNGAADYKFTDNGDGTYVLNMNGQLTSGFKITNGTWDDSGTYGGNGAALELGETYRLSQPGNDIALDCGAVDNPKVVFNPTAKTVVITGNAGDVEISYDIWGNLPAASQDWSATSMDNIEGSKWVAEDVEVTVTSNFGIRELTNGSQSGWISADGTSTISGPGVFPCKYDGTNFTITPGVYTLTFDAEANILTVEGESTGGVVVPSGVTYDIWSSFPSHGGSWGATILENVEGSKWVAENVEVTAQSSFGLREMTNGSQTGWICASGNSTISDSGVFPCKYDGTNFTIYPGVYSFTFDSTALTLTVVLESAYEVTYYLIGDFNGWISADENCKFIQSVENSDEYVLKYEGTIESGTGFKINNGTWDNPNYNIGSKEDGSQAPIELGTPFEYTVAGGSQNIMMATTVVNPNIILNTQAKTITMTGKSSVGEIEIEENVAPVYYNLQGVRIDAPANGLYIVVRGDKVAKELVK